MHRAVVRSLGLAGELIETEADTRVNTSTVGSVRRTERSSDRPWRTSLSQRAGARRTARSAGLGAAQHLLTRGQASAVDSMRTSIVASVRPHIFARLGWLPP